MESNDEMIQLFANAFNLPIISNRINVWFFRTQSGLYYSDFHFNNYIALGWDLISKDLITDRKMSSEIKKEKISGLYPDEQRPGLILGQMETFYNEMECGDLVVIPSSGGRTIIIGTLGEISVSITHVTVEDNEYEKCTYKHKRTVSWLKEVDLWTDVYLSKILRAQQTISNITKYSEMVYRNLHPCYISNDAIHLMLQKKNYSDYSIQDNIDLQSSIMQINYLLSTYLKIQDESNKIKIKTAVGSPGFLEILMPCIPVSAIATACIFRALIGKVKGLNGETATGIMAIISKGNDLWNDHWNRKKIKAEIEQIEAATQKTNAETAQIEATTRKTNAEATQIERMNTAALLTCPISEKGFTQLNKVQDTDLTDQSTVSKVVQCCEVLKKAADNSGIEIDKKLENVS